MVVKDAIYLSQGHTWHGYHHGRIKIKVGLISPPRHLVGNSSHLSTDRLVVFFLKFFFICHSEKLRVRLITVLWRFFFVKKR